MQEGPLYPDDDFDGDDLLGSDDDFDGDDLKSPLADAPALELLPPAEEEPLPGNDEADNTIESVLLDDVPQYDVPRATGGGVVGSGLRRLKGLKLGKAPFLLAAVAIGIAGIVVAALLLTSTLPSPGVTPVASDWVSQCTSNDPGPDPPLVGEGSSGFITWWCGSNRDQAVIDIHIPAGGFKAAYINWTHDSHFIRLILFRVGAGFGGPTAGTPNGCASATSYRNIGDDQDPQGWSASAHNGLWTYCADYVNAPAGGFGSVAVTWESSPP